MNTGVVTTGLVPLTIGSVETFQLVVDLNGLPHSLSAGTASLTFSDPNGNQTTYGATIPGDDALVTYTIIGPPGSWKRAWTWTDSVGVHQVSQSIPFAVVSSP